MTYAQLDALIEVELRRYGKAKNTDRPAAKTAADVIAESNWLGQLGGKRG
jgi:hypothetical protein